MQNSARYTSAADAAAVSENTIHHSSRASVAKASDAATTSDNAAGRTYRDGRKVSERTMTARSAPAISASSRQKVLW